jgi:hypothetical protein
MTAKEIQYRHSDQSLEIVGVFKEASRNIVFIFPFHEVAKKC